LIGILFLYSTSIYLQKNITIGLKADAAGGAGAAPVGTRAKYKSDFDNGVYAVRVA
jgi:hypothetical protein